MDSEVDKMTEEQRNKIRIKIANLVARKPEIDSHCCICGKKGVILHNKDNDNPYMISFICWDCRKDPQNLLIAENYRVDIRTLLDRGNIQVSHYTDQQITDMVVKYMNTIQSVGQYCEQEGISRFQFNKIIDRYDEIFPNQHIKKLMKSRAKKVRKYLLSRSSK